MVEPPTNPPEPSHTEQVFNPEPDYQTTDGPSRDPDNYTILAVIDEETECSHRDYYKTEKIIRVFAAEDVMNHKPFSDRDIERLSASAEIVNALGVKPRGIRRGISVNRDILYALNLETQT